jgi:hypothetical protein
MMRARLTEVCPSYSRVIGQGPPTPTTDPAAPNIAAPAASTSLSSLLMEASGAHAEEPPDSVSPPGAADLASEPGKAPPVTGRATSFDGHVSPPVAVEAAEATGAT